MNTLFDGVHVKPDDVGHDAGEPMPNHDDHNSNHWGPPSRKWLARTVIALGGLATLWAETGGWDKEETIMGITILVGAVTSYLLPNHD